MAAESRGSDLPPRSVLSSPGYDIAVSSRAPRSRSPSVAREPEPEPEPGPEPEMQLQPDPRRNLMSGDVYELEPYDGRTSAWSPSYARKKQDGGGLSTLCGARPTADAGADPSLPTARRPAADSERLVGLHDLRKPLMGRLEKFCKDRLVAGRVPVNSWQERDFTLHPKTGRLMVSSEKRSSGKADVLWDLKGASVEQERDGARSTVVVITYEGEELRLSTPNADSLRRWKQSLRFVAGGGGSAHSDTDSDQGSAESWPSSSSMDESMHDGSVSSQAIPTAWFPWRSLRDCLRLQSEDDSNGGRWPLPPEWTAAVSRRTGQRYWVNR